MNDEQDQLASAYLDGALDDDERARVEADADVMTSVERLREIGRDLAVVAPPDPDRREMAIAAALDVFDRQRLDAEPAAPAPPSLAARRRVRWLMPAAAAVVGVIAAGAIIASQDSGREDLAGQSAATIAAGEATNRVLADEGGAEAAVSAPLERTSEAGAPTTMAAQPTEAPGATASAEAPTAAGAVIVIASPAELTAFAAGADVSRAQDDTTDRAGPRCDDGRSLGHAVYRAAGVDTDVEVFLDARAGSVRAVDASTCATVLTAPAP